MGEVYLARQAGLEGFEKLLVVKVLLPHLVENEEFTRMFLDEARIAARLNHANIAQIFDLGEVDGLYYIAMEYVHGDDVKRIWKKAAQHAKLPPIPLSARIAADAAAGLDYAHKATDRNNSPLGIIHRDVSPQNILVTFEGEVKVIDFGIARAAGRSVHTATGTLKGKYPYMSPEQAALKPLDHRSDIFALGVVLYEMATHERLFARDSEIAILKAVTECEVPRPSLANPAIDERLEGIILKTLSQEPEGRFDSAGELRLALEDWLVQTRQSGSSAHLGAYLKEIYADRLAEEKEQGRPLMDLDQTPSGVVGKTPFSMVSRQGTPIGSRAGRERSELDDTEVSRGQSSRALLEKAHSRGSYRVPIIGFFLAATAVLALLLLGPFATSSQRELTVITNPSGARVILDGKSIGTTPLFTHVLPKDVGGHLEVEKQGYLTVRRQLPASGSPLLEFELESDDSIETRERNEEGAQPATPEEVILNLTSRPSGATVLLGNETLGTTPMEHRVLRSQEPLRLIFRLSGHRPAFREVSPERDIDVDVNLRRARPRKEEPPLDIKTGR